MITGYIRDTWDFGDSVEVEEKHTGRYGAPGEKRQKKRKPTREDIKRQNQWKRERDVRRLIKWNFRERDYWMTITYRKGERPPYDTIKKDIASLIRKVRAEYRKQGWELKYIYRVAIGKRGSPHIHILVNRMANDQAQTDEIFEKCWKHGHINIRMAYKEGDFHQLAKYITKPLEEWEPAELKRFVTSRNLTRKEPKRKEIRRRTLIDTKTRLPKPPKAPKGYYILPDSVRMGKNPLTGYSYRHYTLIKIRSG